MRRIIICLLVLMLIPIAMAESNQTNNETNTTIDKPDYDDPDIIKVFNRTKMLDKDGNYKTDTPRWDNLMKSEFSNNSYQVQLRFRSTNDTIWCKVKDEINLNGLRLYNLFYDEHKGKCIFEGEATDKLDSKDLLSVYAIRQSEQESCNRKLNQTTMDLRNSNSSLLTFNIVLLTIISLTIIFEALKWLFTKRAIIIRRSK